MIVEVPHHLLSPDVLQRLVEEFVTRDGTDYGVSEAALDRKVHDVVRQLASGEAVVLFDTEAETSHIAPAKDRPRD